jgi:outer membrane protein assembly factor BamB
VPILGQTTAIVIIDAEGEIVWHHRDDRDLDFYRARLSLDGKSVLYNAASVSGSPSDASELVRVALDGSESTSIAVPLLAHDFVELPDGTLAAMVVEYREFEGEMLRGDKIVEIDPEGEQTTVFSVWDCFDPKESPGDDIDHGWTFANALDYDPADDAYYLGMRNQSSIVKIDRESGACEWVFGTGAATIKYAPGSARFLHQHQFQVNGNRILVMDNDGSPGNQSRVLEYELDFDAKMATQVWSYVADPSVYTFVLGEPTRMEDGSTFVNWSTAGQLERVTADGESIWKLNSGAGFAFGFHTQEKSLYPRELRTP